MEKELTDLSLEEEEEEEEEEKEEALQFGVESILKKSVYDICLVGCCLTASVFFHEVDMDRVLWSSPWTFNNHLLVLHRLRKGEDPNFVPLVFVEFWVQVHDLLPGFYFEEVARQLGNFVGHGDKFCQKRIDIGMQEVEYGWNLSLKTQSIRAMTTPSVWLREDNSEGIRGETVRTQTAGKSGRGIGSFDLRQNLTFNSTLGFNLEGRGIHDNEEVSSEGMGKANMDEDSMHGGLSLGWKGDLLVSLKSYFINHIDVNIEEGGGLPKWRLTGFYGPPKARVRKGVWDLLRRLRR
ncbi:hypothetical protein Godav_001205 [Gossypium davidsonii]|uniref:DUF4283 domain-containing protein n=1 Tax=Gossypium davidsonii TaxID=34287 RepID=A0A7J8T359_GOSDV|nr:hypothetical protein [Gossypium davidsonii]